MLSIEQFENCMSSVNSVNGFVMYREHKIIL